MFDVLMLGLLLPFKQACDHSMGRVLEPLPPRTTVQVGGVLRLLMVEQPARRIPILVILRCVQLSLQIVMPVVRHVQLY